MQNDCVMSHIEVSQGMKVSLKFILSNPNHMDQTFTYQQLKRFSRNRILQELRKRNLSMKFVKHRFIWTEKRLSI